jgi:hypothetical protein
LTRNERDIISAKKILVVDPNDDLYLIYNDKLAQIIGYNEDNGIVKKFQFDYASRDATIVDVIKLSDEKKTYIIYSDHKIIELSTYLFIPIVFQESKKNEDKVVLAGISYCNINESPIYIANDNTLNMIHQIYNIKERVSRINNIDLGQYIKGGVIKSYSEHFIQSSSITLFTKPYYSLSSYIDSSKYILSKRT